MFPILSIWWPLPRSVVGALLLLLALIPRDALTIEAAAPSAVANVVIGLQDGRSGQPISTARLGQAARLRVTWSVGSVAGRPKETVAWRITRAGKLVHADSATDTAARGSYHWDLTFTPIGGWAKGAVYAAEATVTIGRETGRAMTTFRVTKGDRGTVRLQNVTVMLLDAKSGKKITTVQPHQAVLVRIHWQIAGATGAPDETIAWRITRPGETAYDDSVTDTAVAGVWHWDAKPAPKNGWKAGATYTVAGSVTAPGAIITVTLNFHVAP